MKPHLSGVDHVFDVWDGYGGLSNICGHHTQSQHPLCHWSEHLHITNTIGGPCALRRSHLSLSLWRQEREERKNQHWQLLVVSRHLCSPLLSLSLISLSLISLLLLLLVSSSNLWQNRVPEYRQATITSLTLSTQHTCPNLRLLLSFSSSSPSSLPPSLLHPHW